MKIESLILVFLLFISCSNDVSVFLYTYDTNTDDYVIRGNNVNDFFDFESTDLDIKVQRIQISRHEKDEIQALKNDVQLNGTEDIGIGNYEYAIICDEDTFYIDYNINVIRFNNLMLYSDDNKRLQLVENIINR